MMSDEFIKTEVSELLFHCEHTSNPSPLKMEIQTRLTKQETVCNFSCTISTNSCTRANSSHVETIKYLITKYLVIYFKL
jgi:uncharacterized metal-binding protein